MNASLRKLAARKLAAKVTPAVEVTAMHAGTPFRPGAFYVMSRKGKTPREARVAGPFDTALEAREWLDELHAPTHYVCREAGR